MSETSGFDPSAPLVTHGAPKWVKVLGAVVLLILVGTLVVVFTGGAGSHGPNRHSSTGPVGLHRPAS